RVPTGARLKGDTLKLEVYANFFRLNNSYSDRFFILSFLVLTTLPLQGNCNLLFRLLAGFAATA
ncbi:MAG: hypothetical protein ACLU9Z_17935, partial [Bacteroides intestinalis]